ncbi:MAG TPA: MFS transporter, partial [Casimicrobiaceae bacterium]
GADIVLPAAARPVVASVRTSALFAYGLLGMPLAMAALPLYVYLPKFYGDHLGIPLATLGIVLLLLRLTDGVLDPLLGAWSDRTISRKWLIALTVPMLAIGMVGLFAVPFHGHAAQVAWLGACLMLVYVAFSLATINHAAWGAELSSDPVERTRVTAVREGLALCGVVVASVAPVLLGGEDGEAAGLRRFSYAFALWLALCAVVTLLIAPAGTRAPVRQRSVFAGMISPLADPVFRRLLAVFTANGIASAIPATLVLFYIADVLQSEAQQGRFLALYFIAGAAGMPLWVRLSARAGKVRTWGVAMVIAILAFVWAAFLGAGDTAAFSAVCVLSGLALGADLALPPSLLADVIGRDAEMRATGAYFGLWTLATKLNLALAAGIALPLLGVLGYAPGTREAGPIHALAIVYAGVPCALKLGAIAALRSFERHAQGGSCTSVLH